MELYLANKKNLKKFLSHVANFTHSVGLRQINSLVNSCAHLFTSEIGYIIQLH